MVYDDENYLEKLWIPLGTSFCGEIQILYFKIFKKITR